MRNQKWMAIAASLLLPLAASAQGAANNAGGMGGAGAAGGAAGRAGAQPGGQARGVEQLGQGGANTFAAGTLNGTVEAVNAARGIVRIHTAQGNVAVNAMPSQISALNPGDVVSLNYANYNGTLWVAAPGGQMAFANVPFTNEGRLTGAIAQLGRAQGTITVRGTRFRIHPQVLQGLIPGQFVSVTYANIDGVNWVAAVRPAAGAPTAGQAAGAAGGAGAGDVGAGGAGAGGNVGAGGNAGAGGAGAGGHVGAGAGGTGAGAAGGGNTMNPAK